MDRLVILLLYFVFSKASLFGQAQIDFNISQTNKEINIRHILVLLEEPLHLKAHVGDFRCLGYFTFEFKENSQLKVSLNESYRENNFHFIQLFFLTDKGKENFKFNFSNFGSDMKIPLIVDPFNGEELKFKFMHSAKHEFPGSINPHDRQLIIVPGDNLKIILNKYSISNKNFDWDAPRKIEL